MLIHATYIHKSHILCKTGRAHCIYGRETGRDQDFNGYRPNGKRSLRRPRRRWQNNICSDLGELEIR